MVADQRLACCPGAFCRITRRGSSGAVDGAVESSLSRRICRAAFLGGRAAQGGGAQECERDAAPVGEHDAEEDGRARGRRALAVAPEPDHPVADCGRSEPRPAANASKQAGATTYVAPAMSCSQPPPASAGTEPSPTPARTPARVRASPSRSVVEGRRAAHSLRGQRRAPGDLNPAPAWRRSGSPVPRRSALPAKSSPRPSNPPGAINRGYRFQSGCASAGTRSTDFRSVCIGSLLPTTLLRRTMSARLTRLGRPTMWSRCSVNGVPSNCVKCFNSDTWETGNSQMVAQCNREASTPSSRHPGRSRCLGRKAANSSRHELNVRASSDGLQIWTVSGLTALAAVVRRDGRAIRWLG